MPQAARSTSQAMPRLWVETLWILDSLEADEPLREIQLERGLNLVLSPPADDSTGHGVGKTAFCQLLRFVLEDSQWAAGSSLRDELLQAIPEGAVAARVYVGGEAWTVVKPWRHQRQYRAAKRASWSQLARDEVPNEHAEYVAALQNSLVEILPVRHLPGSNQPIQWQHVLAWCSRDQGSGYQTYYHWRVEGAGFTLPAQSPALVMKIVLSLLKDATTLDRLREQEEKLRRAEADLANVSRRPADLLTHVKHRLTNILSAPENSPFRSNSLFNDTSLLALAKQRREGYEQTLESARVEQEQAESQKGAALEERAPMSQRLTLLKNQIAQVEATIAGNVNEVERLRAEPQALQQLFPQLCQPGNRLFRDCHYVVERTELLQLDRARDVAQRQQWHAQLRADFVQQQSRLGQLEKELAPLNRRIADADKVAAEARKRQVVTLRDIERLDEAIADYELYEGILEGRLQWHEGVERASVVEKLSKEIEQLKVKLETEKDAYSQRRKVIDALMDTIAKKLPGFMWGVFDDSKPQPFRMGPMHSITFRVLETLAGDVTCLLDSTNGDSLHPGFLLHDSPREAEMSEPVFWALLAVVREAGNTQFQYIVTTTTKAPSEFKQFVRVALHTKDDNGMLFRRRIGAESKPLPV